MRTPLLAVLFVTASVVLSILGLLAVRLMVPLEVLRANNEVAGNYLQSLGTLYAVLLAFVVFVVWSQFDQVHASVEQEANELADILRVAGAFPDRVRDRLLHAAHTYALAVVDEEWPAMRKRRESAEAGRLLEEVWETLSQFEPATPRDEALYVEALGHFDDLSDARTLRLIGCSRRLPPTLWALLLAGGMISVSSMYLFGMDLIWPHALMTAAMAGSVAFVLYVIADLDNAFWGDWQVTPAAIHRTLDRDLARRTAALQR